MAEGAADGASATGPAAAKVRVVRCPKCQKLLPELAGFTVYRCGGCGATLRAKHAIPVPDTSSGKSDEERVVVSEDPECCSGNKMITSNPLSENGMESDKSEFRRKLRVGAENPNGSTSESRGGCKEPEEPRLDELRDASQHREGRYTCPSKAPADICSGGADEMAKTNAEEEMQNKLQGDRIYKSQKVQNNPIYKDEERDGLGVLRRTPRTLLEGRFSPYSYEGPSSSHPTSSYGYRDDGHGRHQNTDRSESVESLEQDRAGLLKKLDELRDQLSRSCDIKGKSNERETVNRTASSNPFSRHSQGTWFENSSSMNRTSTRHFPMVNSNNADMQNFYTPPHMQNEVLGYGDPFESQQFRRAPYHQSHQYPQRATESYMYGQFDPDPVISYPHNLFYHQPTCSCPHCCNMHWQASVQDAQPVFPNQRAPYLANSHGLYPLSNPFMLGSSSYNHRGANGSLLSREPQMHQRSVLAKRSGHSCKPVAGGAPFIVCNNCSELLQVPHKLSSVSKNLYKLRCGSCSQVISFNVEGKRLNISSPPSVMNKSLEPINSSADAIAGSLQCPGPSNHGLVNSYSGGDCESSGCNIQSTDEKLILSSLPVASHETIEKEYGLNLSESENMLGLSSSPSSSEDNESTESMVCQRDAPSSSELQPHSQANSRGPGLPLREHFGYPSPDQAVSRPGEGSRSKRFDHEKTVGTNGNFKQNSIKDVSATTEIDLATDKYPNLGLSQDSVEDGKDDQPRMSKGGDSFFAGLIKKSFKDFHRFNQSFEGGKTKVSINGHHIPDRLVKKAEKLAGPIYPGEYWYDYGAGFWGVMGQPCLGIIPPFIEEFNYPMPKNCAGGNTGIVVNGRELHRKDMDLLVGRGLPSDGGRSYRLDISGQVLDVVSGQELDSLGKLAPTVEKLKRGFGLRAPRVLAG
ncbi:hypothetical protein Taro_015473 [Colocasia esculenta]|uniref:Zinc-ribbon domain-containing protein n=1 Tax=Colocasia esculenta TaxID=4460 RepID=A0A843UKX5_COLES|nr:hypothetical protein [Colocasia esculenta]